jgi:hypothetical protein
MLIVHTTTNATRSPKYIVEISYGLQHHFFQKLNQTVLGTKSRVEKGILKEGFVILENGLLHEFWFPFFACDPISMFVIEFTRSVTTISFENSRNYYRKKLQLENRVRNSKKENRKKKL